VNQKAESDRARALKLTPVSDDALARLDKFAALLAEWQSRINLIAPSTVPQLWTRHIADSLQLIRHAPDAKIWVDLGSGAGFPGIPIACALAETPEAKVHLVESNGKKAAFLREAVRITGVSAVVHAERIENFGETFSGKADVVTARALAPLKSLLDQAFPFMATGATGLFLKGQDVEAELTDSAKDWSVDATKTPSLTDPGGCVLIVRRLCRLNRAEHRP
jgi:16S rRNA (guanine527-N7)-methyltransferase